MKPRTVDALAGLVLVMAIVVFVLSLWYWLDAWRDCHRHGGQLVQTMWRTALCVERVR